MTVSVCIAMKERRGWPFLESGELKRVESALYLYIVCRQEGAAVDNRCLQLLKVDAAAVFEYRLQLIVKRRSSNNVT